MQILELSGKSREGRGGEQIKLLQGGGKQTHKEREELKPGLGKTILAFETKD